MNETDGRLHHHVLHLEKLANNGLPSKSMVPVACLSEQDLLPDSHGHSDQEGLQE